MRYAIYHLPEPDSLLAQCGAQWLGWDVHKGEEITRESYVRPHWIASPRVYGFHATLKAPFHLASGLDESLLIDAVHALAGDLRPASLGTLRLGEFSGFLAFAAPGADMSLTSTAAACVTELDSFRASASEGELAKRRAAGLNETEEANLAQWGYPYVLDRFRFHMTVTGALDKPDRDEAKRVAEEHFADATAGTATLTALSVLKQTVLNTPFREIARFDLRGR
ncbi:MAG: DUF1045 domain-containing protein [Pseudomonadota bacterium]